MPMHVHHLAMAAGNHLDLLAFLTLGLLGSAAHCLGMCAPFVLLVSRRYGTPQGGHRVWAAQLWYTIGRLCTYSVLGALAGVLGTAVQSAGAFIGLQRAAAVIAGVTLVLTALGSLLAIAPGGGLSHVWLNRITSRLGRRMPGHPLALGLLLGLLPCGLLYSAVVGAMATGGVAPAALALFAFGLGTVPALLGVSIADALLVSRRTSLNRLSQVFVLVMGVWFIWSAVLPSSHL
jgi:hypothetical protein